MPSSETIPTVSSDAFIGISMPTQDLLRWSQDGADMKEKFEAAGGKVDLQFAGNEVSTQISQIENMISEGVNVLVIAAVDGQTLAEVLEPAKDAGIRVVAYDRPIMNSDAVSYCCTFDNYMIGTIQGQYIKDQLRLDEGGSYNLEITAGDPGDSSAISYYQGAINVLQPYIDSGVLKVPSGQTEFNVVTTPSWSTETAQARMEAILAAFYADGTQLDACLCSNDSTAKGVTNALASSYVGKYPIVTGQDCEIANVKDIIAGKQSMSVFKDARTLAMQTVRMVFDILAGKTPETNDATTYDNGVKIVPTYLCAPVFVDINNYKELLIDSGYYDLEQLR